ncbi:MAG: flagellar basal body protein [Thermogemmata sp.]|nr:flagellar basal body protein [Thermogemmata sp.]
MINGIYTATSGLLLSYEQQNIYTNNFANLSTSGYKELNAAVVSNDFNDFSSIYIEQIWNKNDIGNFVQTNNPLDFAIASPDCYFVVQGPLGQILTRNSTFYRSNIGTLVDGNGNALLGERGIIRIPDNVSNIQVSNDGVIYADYQEIDKIQIVSINNQQSIKRIELSSSYQIENRDGIRQSNSWILQGYKEQANVDIYNQQIKMLLGLRYSDFLHRIVRMTSDIIQLSTRA